MSGTTRWLGCALAAMALTACNGPAGAGEYYWKNTGGGTFSTGSNWNGDSAPGSGDNANFTSNASYQVDWSANAGHTKGSFNAPGGTVTLNVGAGQIWTLSDDFSVGSSAGASAAVALSSGSVEPKRLVIGSSGSYNSLTIGANAVMKAAIATQGALVMGGGQYNTLTVSGGGRLNLEGGAVWTTSISGTGNRVVVTDSGSYLSLTNNNIAITGSYNELIVSNGATVRVQYNISLANDHNTVRASGAGSSLRFSGSTAPALSGTDNRIMADNGGLVTVDSFLSSGASGNSHFLADGGTIRSVNDSLIKDAGQPSVIVTNGGKVVSANGRVGWNGGTGYTGTVFVTGNGSVWSNSVDLVLGQGTSSRGTLTAAQGGLATAQQFIFGQVASSRSTLMVTNGGVARAKYLNFGGNGSRMTVSGNGSEAVFNSLAAASPFVLGNAGRRNVLRVINGGRFAAKGTQWYSSALNGTSNSVIVSGAGSVFSLTNNHFHILGSYNEFIVTNQSLAVFNGSLFFPVNGTGNTIRVTGQGSHLSVPIAYSYGIWGTSNRFLVTDGATVTNAGYISSTHQRGGGYVVSGAGSRLHAALDLYVADNASSPSLTVAAGGYARSDNGRLAFSTAGSSTGTVMVTGSGSIWTNTGNVVLGEAANSRALLTVGDGGRVFCTDLYVGSGAGSRGTARFVGGVANGPGSILIKGTLRPRDNGTLEIDVTRCPPGIYTLMRYANRERAFAPAEIIQTGREAYLSQSATEIVLTVPAKGTVITLR